MTCRAATFDGVPAFDRRALAGEGYRLAIRRSVGIGLGTVTTAGLMAGTAAVAAAWLVATSLGSAPQLRTQLALETAGPSQARGFVGKLIAGLPPTFSRTDDLAFASPPPEAEHDKGPRLRAAFARIAAREPIRAQRDNTAETASAPPSGLIAATFDLLDPKPAYTVAYTAAIPARQNEPPQAQPQRVAENVIEVPPLPRTTQQQPMSAAAAAKPALPQVAALTPAPQSTLSGFLRKLFSRQPAPDVSMLVPGADSHTAVYDIEAHTVYLPNGEKLEAHSGLGGMIDDPRYVTKKARGPTPPNVYDLALRDGLFHGVQAIRLNPVSDDRMYGRDGILAHPYMLGPSGQSFGCVSFKDYATFLKAFRQGEFDRLVVVSHLDTRTSEAAPATHKRYERYAVNN